MIFSRLKTGRQDLHTFKWEDPALRAVWAYQPGRWGRIPGADRGRVAWRYGEAPPLQGVACGQTRNVGAAAHADPRSHADRRGRRGDWQVAPPRRRTFALSGPCRPPVDAAYANNAQAPSPPGSILLAMFAARLALATALGALAATSCGSDGGTSTGTTSGATATTGASSSSTTDASPTTDTPTTTGSTTQGSSDGTSLSTSSGDATSSTGDSSSGGSTSSASRGTSTSTGSESTGGGMPIAFFDCTELTVVDLQLKEKISGAFDAQGVPLAVLATMVARSTFRSPSPGPWPPTIRTRPTSRSGSRS